MYSKCLWCAKWFSFFLNYAATEKRLGTIALHQTKKFFNIYILTERALSVFTDFHRSTKYFWFEVLEKTSSPNKGYFMIFTSTSKKKQLEKNRKKISKGGLHAQSNKMLIAVGAIIVNTHHVKEFFNEVTYNLFVVNLTKNVKNSNV